MAMITEALNEREAAINAELDAIRKIRKHAVELKEMFSRFPALGEAFRRELYGTEPVELAESDLNYKPPTTTTPAVKGRRGGILFGADDIVDSTHTPRNMDRIRDFLRTREAATIADIASETGIPIHSVRHLIYVRHRGKFRQVSRPGRASWFRNATPQELRDTFEHQEEE
jgi:hypothetical protein